MIEEQGQIVKTDGQFAWVRTQRKSTCGQCSVQKGCGTSVFSKVLGNKMVEFKAINRINATAGDNVVLGLHESVLLKSAVLVYILPLFSMFIFALLTPVISAGMGTTVSQAWVGFFAVVGLLFGFLCVRFFTRYHQADERYHPVILRRTTFAEQYSFTHLQKI